MAFSLGILIDVVVVVIVCDRTSFHSSIHRLTFAVVVVVMVASSRLLL